MRAKSKAIVYLLLKIIVTGVLLWWLSQYFNYQQIRESLREVDPGLIALAVGLHILSYMVGGVRWWLLFRHLAGPVSLRQIMPSYYLGVFLNNILPSAYGGDLARSARLYVSGMSGSALVGSALMDRILGLVSVVMMGGVALILMPPGLANRFAWPVLGACFLGLVFAFILFVLPDWVKIVDRGLGQRWPRIHAVLSCFPKYRAAPKLLLIAFGLSVLNQALVVIVFLLLAPAVGIDVPLLRFVVILMLVFLVASLPISLGGLGPREGVLMALLLPLGVDSSLVLTLSIVYLFVLWCAAMPGVLVLLFKANEGKNAEAKSAQ
ncbi:MAG: flippase-like domain-containing protein [Proteobacteria bacterium]|nr:flippase-like domain-containing protein [Pseudomonadota bacterium]